MNESRFYIDATLYHEARNEPFDGLVAIVHVILTRSEERGMSVKDVVLQPLQFSCYNGNQRPSIRDYRKFIRCQIARDTAFKQRLRGNRLKGINHYHADYIETPRWTKDMLFIKKVGLHLFYRG